MLNMKLSFSESWGIVEAHCDINKREENNQLLLLLFSHYVVSDSFCGTPASSVLECLPEFAQLRVQWVQWCCLTISSSVTLFSFCLQSFPALGSFPMSWFFASGGQSSGASVSTSILPMNIQGCFPLGLIDLISLQFKSNNSSVVNLLCGPTLISIHDYWKSQSFDDTDLCQQSDVCLCFLICCLGLS